MSEGGGIRFCAVIPVFDHADTAVEVARAAAAMLPTIVVDDGSSDGVSEKLAPLRGVEIIRHERNLGKGAALRTGFARAAEAGFTHAITIDADGQHSPEDIPRFMEASRAAPEAIIAGVRDLARDRAPFGRRLANAFSNFWFRVETGLKLKDTQCGFRCYPLHLVRRLRTKRERYAYELEVLVRAAWAGIAITQLPIAADYERPGSRKSHFHPLLDFLRISRLNFCLVAQAVALPRNLRARMSVAAPAGETFRNAAAAALRDLFTEHAETPGRLAASVGLGLFCGIAPIWGFQMIAAASLAHAMRLNKAIALAASNISVPPVAPFIVFGSLLLGHWIMSGELLEVSIEAARNATLADAMRCLGEYIVGSVALGAAVGITGAAVSFLAAKRRSGGAAASQ